MDKDLDFEKLKEQLQGRIESVEDVNILFFDLSSNCTGYSLMKVNFKNKTAVGINAGVIWFDPEWNVQDKISYLAGAIQNYFNIVGKIDLCVCEAFMVNFKKMSGVLISPMLHGGVAGALAEINVKYLTYPVSSWRKHLQIKKDPVTKDFKEPCKRKIEEFVTLPEKINSNITSNLRDTPNDLADALGLGLGFLKSMGFNKFDLKNTKFQESINF